jgi:hypothetical protein
MKKGLRRSVIVILSILLVLGVACGEPEESDLPITPDAPEVRPEYHGTGTIFIWAIGNGDEQLALSLLTERTQASVAQYCENGRVITCFDDVGLQDWGTTESIYFLPDFSDGSTAVYGVSWSTDSFIWFVLEIVDEDGEWRIDSWRGLIPSKASEGEIPYELFEGTDKTNLFPPEE